jgi:hypothetical protein
MRNHSAIKALVNVGIDYTDAIALRRISLTLHRWHELECGTSNDYNSFCLVRGRKPDRVTFEYDDHGTPFYEVHSHHGGRVKYEPVPDRETGAKKRLAAIMARYPTFKPYIQTDPRGCALYILDAGQPEDRYSSGIAVHR